MGGGCHAKQSRERKDCFQTFPLHQAIKITSILQVVGTCLQACCKHMELDAVSNCVLNT